MKIIVFSPSYNEKSGGVVVLHKLCSLINEMDGFEASMVPYFSDRVSDSLNPIKKYLSPVKSYLYSKLKTYITNPYFDTPIFKGSLANLDDYLVIYPETTFGNPLKAKNVVRWLLHQPGFHTKDIFYGSGELYFKFNSAIDDFHYPGSSLSQKELKVVHYPTGIYNCDNVEKERTGDCYAVRKGIGKSFVHDVKNAVIIDGKSHLDIACIFKKSKRFISYDTYTAYSIFAVLCGCESVVVPDKGVSKDEWYPNEKDRYGIAYGLTVNEKIISLETAHLVKQHVLEEENSSTDNVASFLFETQTHFSL
jgi:hypothetical protein